MLCSSSSVRLSLDQVTRELSFLLVPLVEYALVTLPAGGSWIIRCNGFFGDDDVAIGFAFPVHTGLSLGDMLYGSTPGQEFFYGFFHCSVSFMIFISVSDSSLIDPLVGLRYSSSSMHA